MREFFIRRERGFIRQHSKIISDFRFESVKEKLCAIWKSAVFVFPSLRAHSIVIAADGNWRVDFKPIASYCGSLQLIPFTIQQCYIHANRKRIRIHRQQMRVMPLGITIPVSVLEMSTNDDDEEKKYERNKKTEC